jgi:hypothetical protein
MNELFPHTKKFNHVSSQDYHKITVNIPNDIFSQMMEDCLRTRPPITISHWIREAIVRKFNTGFTMKQEVRYAIMKELGEIRSDAVLPPKVATRSTRTEPDHGMHKYPGFIAGLRKNQFVWNLFRREHEMNGHE